MGSRKVDRRFAAASTAVSLILVMVPFIAPAAAQVPANTCLQVTPETDSNPTGDTHTITATLTQISGGVSCGTTPVTATADVLISFELSGANDTDGNTPDAPDAECTIGAGQSSCTYDYSGNNGGTDTIRGWIDSDGESPPTGLTEADRTEGQQEGTQPGTGCLSTGGFSAPEPDCTDVVTKTWTPSNLDCEPEADFNPTGQPHEVTCTVTDEGGASGAPAAGTKIDVEATGANDSDNQNGGTPDFTCTTEPSDDATTTDVDERGQCSFTHSGSLDAGVTLYRAWIDDDGVDTNTTEGDTSEGVATAGAVAEEDDTDVVQKTWTASRLDCEPETDQNPTGTTHTITCTATDERGTRQSGTAVDAEATGQNDPDGGNQAGAGTNAAPPDYTCTTGEDGTCSFTTAESTRPGATTYRAWIDDDGPNGTPNDNINEGDTAETQSPDDNDDTDVVTKNWVTSSPTRLDCDDQSGDDRETNPGSSGAQSNETYVCTLTDAQSNLVGGAPVYAEVENGVNDPDNPDSASYESPDYTCTTGSSGTGNNGLGKCTITVTQADVELGTAEICFFNATDTATGGSASLCGTEPTDETENNDLADQVEKTWEVATPAEASQLDCEPEAAANPQDTQHAVECTVRNPQGVAVAGAEVDVEATGANDPDSVPANSPTSPDFTCITDNTGSCTIYHGNDTPSSGQTGTGTTTDAGVTTYRGWIDFDNRNDTTEADTTESRDEQTQPGAGCLDPLPDTEPDCTDVVEKVWGASQLDCAPETDRNPSGSSHTVTCTATDENGELIANVNVDAEATGANDPDTVAGNSPTSPDFTCTTDATGTCSFTHGGSGTGNSNTAGETTYRAWIDADKNNSTTEADTDEGPCSSLEGDEADCAPEELAPGRGCTFPVGGEPDCTDVVTKTWTASRLNCVPDTDSNPTGTRHDITCTATDVAGNTVAGTEIDAEATGTNDPDSSDSPTSPDFTCTTDDSGTCEISHGPGGTGTTNDAGTTTYEIWIDDDLSDTTTEADQSEPVADPSSPEDGTDVVTKAWVPSPLECEPETDGNPAGSSHTVTCTARNSSNQVEAGIEIDVEATGANDPDGGNTPTSPDFTCTTQANGQCSFTHGPGGTGTTGSMGTTTYRAWRDDDKSNTTMQDTDLTEGRDESTEPGSSPETDETDVVAKTWGASGLDCTPETSSGAAGTTHTITCRATHNGAAVASTQIDVEATGANDPDNGNSPTTPDFGCTTGNDGSCTFTHTGNGAGETTYRAWIDSDTRNSSVDGDQNEGRDESSAPGSTGESDTTDVVTRTWTASRLECTPETAVNVVGTSHTVTCTATSASNALSAGVAVDVEATGANDPDDGNTRTSPDFTCTTASNGTCSFTHGPSGTTDEGETLYRAWIDADGANTVAEADASEGANESSDPGAAEPDSTDVVAKSWVRDAPECSDGEDNDGDGETDYPDDGGCSSETDDSEADLQCKPAREGENVILGTPGADVISGTPGRDLICGFGGADVINGRGGRDRIFGQGDSDTLSGGGGNDRLVGGAGNDNASGNDGADLVQGGGGADTIKGNAGTDRLRGGAGADSLQGGGGEDVLTGGGGNDTLRGGRGRDRLDGGTGRDLCFGNAGNDSQHRCE